MKIGLLITGNELLNGKARDSNGPLMATALAQRGSPVEFSVTCGDVFADIQDSLSYLASRCDVILMTGGLGPTSDDLTAEAIANFFGLKREFNNEAWEHCVNILRMVGRSEIAESNRKQAFLPLGTKLLPNPNGTAVGFYTRGQARGSEKTVGIFAMPGVPHEFEPMFKDSVIPLLQVSALPGISKVWQIFAMGESGIQSALSIIEKQLHQAFPTSVISYQAHVGYVTYTVSLNPSSQSEADQFKEFLASSVEPFLDEALTGKIAYRTSETVAQYLVTSLTRLNKKLAFAESCTGGLIAQEICSLEGASAVFPGAVVSYSNLSKQTLLHVPADLLEKKGAVHREVVSLMARSALDLFNSDIALSVSGIAGPQGGSMDKPVGMACFGLSLKKASIQNIFGLKKALDSVEWLANEWDEKDEILTLTSIQKFGSQIKRTIIQKKSCNFALCSLALIVPFLTSIESENAKLKALE